MRPVVVALATLAFADLARAQIPAAPVAPVVQPLEEEQTIAVLPLRVEGLQLNEIQRINVQMRLRAASRGGFKVQSESDTTALVEATQSLGLSCDVNAVECGVRVGQIADVGFVLLGRATGGLDGHVGIDVMVVDVNKGEAVRHVSALLPSDPAKETAAINGFADTLFAKAGSPQAQLVALSLTIEPPGAEIVVDGVARGLSPLPPLTTLAPGDHYVVVQKKGFITYRSRLAVHVGEAASLQITLAVDPDAFRTGPTGLEAAAPWIVASIGGAALIGGGIAAALSGARYLAFEDARTAIEGVDVSRSLSDAEVEAIAANHAIAEAAAKDWGDWGQATFVGGVVSAGIGLIVAAGGIGWGLVQLDDVGGEEPATTAPAR